MSEPKQEYNIPNISELEEGEISEPNIKISDNLKLNVLNNIPMCKQVRDLRDQASAFTNLNNPSEFINLIDSDEKSQSNSQVDDEEESQGYFHKMLKAETVQEVPKSDQLLNKKQQRAKEPKNKVQLKKEPKVFKPRQICNYFLHGACHKGNECTFSHDVQPIKNKELCKYFLTGNCFKGDKCLFSHNTEDFPCKFYQARGWCDAAECRFSHERLTPEEIQQFIEENEEFLFEIMRKYGKTNMDDYFFRHIRNKKQDKSVIPSDAMIPESFKENLNNTIQLPKMNIQDKTPPRPTIPQLPFINPQAQPMNFPFMFPGGMSHPINKLDPMTVQMQKQFMHPKVFSPNPMMFNYMMTMMMKNMQMQPKPNTQPELNTNEVIFNSKAKDYNQNQIVNPENILNKINPFDKPPTFQKNPNKEESEPEYEEDEIETKDTEDNKKAVNVSNILQFVNRVINKDTNLTQNIKDPRNRRNNVK